MDVAIDLDPQQLVSLFILAELREMTETQLGSKVDLGLRQNLLWPIVQKEVPGLLAAVEAELGRAG